MGYLVLARKYRPKDFEGLVGQEHLVQTLSNAVRYSKLASAYLFTGTRGVGKTTAARIFSRVLNYETDDIKHPSVVLKHEGYHCRAILEGTHVDVTEMDAASHTSIDDIRKIIDQVNYQPMQARFKIFIIDEIHMLSKQAFNGLLKTIEEPPPYVKFIFATTEIQKLPLTIISRTQHFELRKLQPKVIAEYLDIILQKEGISAVPAPIYLISKLAEGSMRDALTLLDQAIALSLGNEEPEQAEGKAIKLMPVEKLRQAFGLGMDSLIQKIYSNLLEGNLPQSLYFHNQVYASGAEPNMVLRQLLDMIYQLTILALTNHSVDAQELSQQDETGRNDKHGNYDSLLTDSGLIDISEDVKKYASLPDCLILFQYHWQQVSQSLEQLKDSVNGKIAVDMLLLRLSMSVDLSDLSASIGQLDLQPQIEENRDVGININAEINNDNSVEQNEKEIHKLLVEEAPVEKQNLDYESSLEYEQSVEPKLSSPISEEKDKKNIPQNTVTLDNSGSTGTPQKQHANSTTDTSNDDEKAELKQIVAKFFPKVKINRKK